MEVIMIFIFLFVLPTVVSQKLVYNTTYCKQHGSIFNASSILPRFPSYAMSISSSTYQAGKPITIEVKACKQNGFRAFLLKATIQGYVYTGVNPKSIKLGTIMVSCGVRKGSLNYINYDDTSQLDIMKFQWIPPIGAYGNITFHFTAIPRIPSVYWLTFGKNQQGAGGTQINVEQTCSSASIKVAFGFSATVIMVILQWLI